MADIITRGDSFTVFLGTDGEFKVDRAWLDGLQNKLQKMTDAEIEVTLNDRADHLSIRAIGECKGKRLDLERLMRRLSRAADWYIFWHRKGVKVFKILEYRDRRLGTLTYHRNFEWWEADEPIVVDSTAEDEPFEFNLYLHGLEGRRPPRALIARAHKAIGALSSLNDQCLEAIGNELLDVYNNMGWRGENPEMSRDEFMGHFSLSTIHIDEQETKLDFFVEDELFTEHGVCVTFTEGAISHVSLE
jgi:hypothetical protein